MGKGLGFMSRGLAIAIIATCAVVAPLAGIAAAGQADGSGGSGDTAALATLKVENPSVQVKKAGAQKFKDAKDGQTLREGDTVKTDATGKAEIDYSDDAYTRLDVNTTFTVVSLTDDQGNRQIKGSLESGQTWNRTVALTESESYEQEGGGATAAVAGTAFAVECATVDHCDFTAVVDITTLTGVDGVQKLLSPLDQCDSTSGVLCGDITQISVDDLPDWITQNLLRDLIERGLDDGGLRGTVVIEDDGTVNFLPAPPVVVAAETVTQPPNEPPVDDSTAPNAPTGVGALPGWESATVSWTPGADGGSPITSYTVTATAITPSGLEVLSCTAVAPATSCVVPGLSHDVTYTFTVTATNAKGTSQPSAPSNPVTPPIVVPYGSEYEYSFDNTVWSKGNAPFATGTPGVCPSDEFPPGNTQFPVDGEIWIRITITLPDGASGLEIVGTVDNIGEFFVNDSSVGTIGSENCVPVDVTIPIPDHLLVEGPNVILVHATDTGSQSFLDLTVRYTDPGGEEVTATQDAPAAGDEDTTTTSTTEPTTTTTEPTTTTTEPTTTTTLAPPTE